MESGLEALMGVALSVFRKQIRSALPKPQEEIKDIIRGPLRRTSGYEELANAFSAQRLGALRKSGGDEHGCFRVRMLVSRFAECSSPEVLIYLSLGGRENGVFSAAEPG